jgi:hypothetical protein
MYDEGNGITAMDSVPYTNGVISSSGGAFGNGSAYFTAKYPGLFVLAATDSSATSLQINGNTGADGNGTVDRNALYTTVDGQPYTILLRRVYGAGTPSINHLIIVPGNDPATFHTDSSDTDSDYHYAFNLPAGRQVYYLLVSSANGGFISNADVLNIGNEFLANVAAANIDGTASVTVAPGQNVADVDFGSLALPPLLGDYNRDGSVDAADSVVWRNSLGQTVVPYQGADGDGDGTVDQDDRAIWMAHFGEVLAPPAAAASATVFMSGGNVAEGPEILNSAIEAAPLESGNVASPGDESGRLVHAALSSSETGSSERRMTSHSTANRAAKFDAVNHLRAHEAGLMAWLAQDNLNTHDEEIDARDMGDEAADGIGTCLESFQIADSALASFRTVPFPYSAALIAFNSEE